MEQDSEVNLKWDAHQSTLKSVFDTLLDSESLADCTVGAEGQHLKAHKLILSACSRYFEVLFSQYYGKHTIIVLPGVQFHILKALMEFMYRGEVLVPQDDLNTLLQLADFLQVKGLSHGDNVVADKKQTRKRRNKSPTTSICRASPESYKVCDSAELLEVPGSSSQLECLQKQDQTKITPISTPAHKRKKSDWHSSREEPQHREAHSLFSDSEPRSSLESQLPEFKGNLSNATVAGEELLSAKCLNSPVRTSICPTVSEENTILKTFAELKQENCSDLSEDCVQDVILDSDDNQNTCDNSSVVQKELTDDSFCKEESFTQQIQFHQVEWPNTNSTEATSASNNQFKCRSCDRSYRYYSNLVRHLKYECGVQPQFQCPQCLARYRHKHSLKDHMAKHNL